MKQGEALKMVTTRFYGDDVSTFYGTSDQSVTFVHALDEHENIIGIGISTILDSVESYREAWDNALRAHQHTMINMVISTKYYPQN